MPTIGDLVRFWDALKYEVSYLPLIQHKKWSNFRQHIRLYGVMGHQSAVGCWVWLCRLNEAASLGLHFVLGVTNQVAGW